MAQRQHAGDHGLVPTPHFTTANTLPGDMSPFGVIDALGYRAANERASDDFGRRPTTRASRRLIEA